MEIFDSNDKNSSDDFLKWMEANPGGFFINFKSRNDLMIHKVPCGHFVFSRPVNLAKHTKVCASNRQELEAWAKKESPKKLKICSTCKP